MQMQRFIRDFYIVPMFRIWLFIAVFSLFDVQLSAQCSAPAPEAGCDISGVNWDSDVVATGNVTWNSLGIGSADNVVNKIRISGTGTVTVTGTNLLLKSSGAIVFIDGPTLILDNGNLSLDASGARYIQHGGALRTFANFQQTGNTVVCITDTDIEIGEEEAGTNFTVENFTSANWINDGGYRYLENNCINVTQNFQLQSSGSGTGINGRDVIINCCIEIGDKGPNHATPTAIGTADGNDTGNWQNSNRQEIYSTDIVIANGDYQTSNGTATLCQVDIKANKSGNFQVNSGTLNGDLVCVAVEDIFENSGTWTATNITWYSKINNTTNVPGAGAETDEATILAACFDNSCCANIAPVCMVTAAAGNDATICSGSSTNLDASASTGSGALTYSWSPSDGLSADNIANPVATPANTTSYILTVTSDNDCTDQDTVVITVLTPMASPMATSLCQGGSVTVDGLPTGGSGIYTTHAWSDLGTGTASGHTLTNTDTQIVTLDASVATAGTVNLQYVVTDDAGCSATETVTITINGSPACSVNGAVNVQENTPNHIYSGPDGMSGYQWTITGNGSITSANNQQSITVEAGSAGSFTLSLTITDINGCTSNCEQAVTVTATNNSPVIGIAKAATSVTKNDNGTFDVIYLLKMVNYGDVTLTDIRVSDNLDAEFGTYVGTSEDVNSAGTYTIVSAPDISETTNGANISNVVNAYNGSANQNIINPASGEIMPVGSTVSFTYTIRFFPQANKTAYQNQAIAYGDSVENGVADGETTDLSDDGACIGTSANPTSAASYTLIPNPDIDCDGNPNETGENDPTYIHIDQSACPAEAGNLGF